VLLGTMGFLVEENGAV